MIGVVVGDGLPVLFEWIVGDVLLWNICIIFMFGLEGRAKSDHLSWDYRNQINNKINKNIIIKGKHKNISHHIPYS